MPAPLHRILVGCLSLTVLLSLALTANAAGQPAGKQQQSAIANVRVSKDDYLAHSEPSVAENPRNPNDLVAGSKMFTSPENYQFKIGTYYSKDGGKTWHDSGFLPGFDNYRLVSDISIAFGPDGTAYASVLAWDGGLNSGVFVSRSTDGGKTFSDPVPVFLDSTGATFSDKNWIGVDNSQGPNRGTIYVAWNLDGQSVRNMDPDNANLNRALRPNATDAGYGGMVVAHSTDGGKTWSDPVMVAPFDQQHFYIGAIPAVAPNGRLYVAFTAFDGSGVVNGFALVSSNDGGQTFDDARIVQDDVVGVPDHLSNGTFRNTTMPSFAISPKDGTMALVWSDYRYGDSDIMVTISKDGGKTWSASARVNHDPARDGKDQFQPVVAVSPNGTFTCAWFDRSYDPRNRLIDEVVAQSFNDGKTFGPAVRVTEKSWDPAIGAPRPEGKPSNTFIGDYQALAVDNHTVHPLWNDTQNGKSQEIRTAAIGVQVFKRK